MTTLKKCVTGFLPTQGGLFFVALALGLILPRLALATPGAWSLTAPMTTVRSGHTATRLVGGVILVTGGTTDWLTLSPLATAELYNPVSKSFIPTAAPMAVARAGHTATLLPGGLVLVAGGTNGASLLNTAELYISGILGGGFSSTIGDMAAARAYHTATLLPSGKVLVAGGKHGSGVLAHSELYDPATGEFTPTNLMKVARYDHTATLLPSGKVLVTGGKDGHRRSSG